MAFNEILCLESNPIMGELLEIFPCVNSFAFVGVHCTWIYIPDSLFKTIGNTRLLQTKKN